MKKIFKRTLAVLLAAVMLFGTAPLSGFVGLELPEFDFFKTKAEAATVLNGKCGDSLTWTLDRSAGVLSIEGTGDMYNYTTSAWSGEEAPWESYSHNVNSLLIGNGVTSIGDYAFSGCEIDSTVTIPKNINKIGNHAFSRNPIESFDVSSDNMSFSSDASGTLYNKDKTVLIQYPVANPRTNFTVPTGVITIEEEAFAGAYSLQSGDKVEFVTLPDTVRVIKRHAFAYCQSLKGVTLGNALTTIEEYAFEYCESLSSISIPDSVETIENGAFSYCDSLSEVTIGKGAAKNEDGDELDFHLIFRGCLIKNYIVSDEHPFLYSSEGVVFSKSGDKNELIAYPLGNPRIHYDIPEGTTDINGMAFDSFYQNKNCKLKSIKLPSTIADLGSGQLECLYCLEEIIVDNSHPTLLSEDGVLFSKDKTDLMIYPKNKSGNSYTVPDSVNSISSSAFEDAIHLYDISIPESVRYIGHNAFYKCGYYNNVNNWRDEVLYIDQWLVDVKKSKTGSLEIREGTVHSSFWAFYYCKNITELTIPSSFEDDDFYGCDNVETLFFNAANFRGRINFDSLKTVYIGDTVEQLGTSAVWDDVFQDITTLESVVFLPTDSLKKFDFSVFSGCINLKTLILPDSVEEVNLNFNVINNCSVVHIPSTAKITGWNSYNGITADKSVHICSEADLADLRSKEWLLNYYSFKVCDGSHSISMVGKVTGIDIPQTKIQMTDSAMLMEATVYPETAVNKEIIWTSSNPSVADFYGENGVLIAYSNGYTVVTATTVDGGYSDSCIVFVGESSMTLRSNYSFDVPIGQTNEYNVTLVDLESISLTETREVSIDKLSDKSLSGITAVIANADVAIIDSLEVSDGALNMKVKGKKVGTTYVTLTNTETDEVIYFPINVFDGEAVYTYDTIPQTVIADRGVSNFIKNGMNIHDFKCEENADGSSNVSFNVYNTSMNIGVVEVFDENGTRINTYSVSAFDNNDLTSVKDNVERFGVLVTNTFKAKDFDDVFDVTTSVGSAHTPISTVVPENGYIRITNDISASDACLVYNMVDIAVKVISAVESIDLGNKSKQVTDTIGKAITEEIADSFEGSTSSFFKKLILEINKASSFDDYERFIEYFASFLNSEDIDFNEIFMEVMSDVLYDVAEDLALKSLGTYGEIVSSLYSFNSRVKIMHMLEDCQDFEGTGSAYIYDNQTGEQRVSNGIVLNGNIGTETVFRTYSVTYGGVYDGLADENGEENTRVYEISMVKNGECVQPETKVQVRIPIPENWVGDKITVYRVTDNNECINMNAHRDGDYMVFETDHFSYYALVNEFELITSILNPSTTTISYGDSIILHADLNEALPEGWRIEWSADNGNFSYEASADGSTCTITPSKSGDTTFTVTVYDADGNEISKDTQKMTSKAGFFDKIIAFFKKIFGLTKIIIQAK